MSRVFTYTFTYIYPITFFKEQKFVLVIPKLETRNIFATRKCSTAIIMCVTSSFQRNLAAIYSQEKVFTVEKVLIMLVSAKNKS